MGPGPRSILWTVGWGAPGLGRTSVYADGFRRNAPATVGLPGLKDAVDDMSVDLITGKPTLDEAA